MLGPILGRKAANAGVFHQPSGSFWRGLIAAHLFLAVGSGLAGELTGRVVDADSGQPLAARVYVRDFAGQWRFVRSTDPQGSAVPYQEQWVPMESSSDRHTSVSAHPWQVTLEPGEYEVTIERGKEYLTLSRSISIGADDLQLTFPLQRWIDLAQLGWYSGETHVHRRLPELPTAMLAEDLNVAFPVTFWTTQAYRTPGLEPSSLRRQGPSPFGPRVDVGAEPIAVDATHVIYPRNTEYEIFSVDDRPHVLGAIFILNHRSVFQQGMPPTAAIAAAAHQEGALLDLDKHNWPWSMMLVPIAKVDLYELANNSLWRTRFGFRNSLVAPADYMQVQSDEGGITEEGWIQFGLENYYALLDCGFPLQPTAGTASGVHPVPLGFGRVYVHLDGGFDGQQWIDGLRQGRSFVTTGPALLATVDQRLPGALFPNTAQTTTRRVAIRCHSSDPLERIEVVCNGEVVWRAPSDALAPSFDAQRHAYAWEGATNVEIERTSWLVVRCYARTPEGRIRFAHTAPWRFSVAEQPMRPRRAAIDYLVQRMRTEVKRNDGVLPERALAEFRQALEIYESIAQRAVDLDAP